MNTRALQENARLIPTRVEAAASPGVEDSQEPEAVIFDKAEEAEALDELRTKQQALEQQIESDEQSKREVSTDAERDQIERRISAAKSEHERVTRTLERDQNKATTED